MNGQEEMLAPPYNFFFSASIMIFFIFIFSSILFNIDFHLNAVFGRNRVW